MSTVKEKPQSMADIAEMLGVTAVSVSLALRNSPLISQELRDQVQKIANETGFKARNYRRRSAAEKERPSDGKIVVLYEAANSDDPVAQQIMNSVMKRLSDLKATFEVCSCEELYENPALAAGSAGVIYHYCFRPWFSSILEGIPQVAIMHEEIDLGPWDSFKPNELLAGKLAANYLIDRGFGNALLTWEHKMAYRAETHPRLEGFRRRMREAGATVSELAYGRDDDPQLYFNELKGRLATFGNRAGIFAFNDQVAYKVCHTLNFLGLERKPKELEVVSCDNTFLIRELHPPLPVVDLHISEIAERAVEGLFWRLEHPDACYQDVMLKPELVLPPSE
ncbi:MAG: LacI family DNA-binding transcriptional regulator [Lentisphaeria bacterium]|nr:LacI family DNA-binding transcriptional regulator [Lentisphaeria bacterium]